MDNRTTNRMSKHVGFHKLDIFGRNRRQLEKENAELRRQEAQRAHELRIQEYEHQRQQKRWEGERAEQKRKEKEREEKKKHDAMVKQAEEQRRQEEERAEYWRLAQTTPAALRGLRDLIRQRYELDLSIWGLRGVRSVDRPIILTKMAQSDAILKEMKDIVLTWNGNDGSWTKEEWMFAARVKELVLMDGKRVWADNPPWNDR